MDDVERAAPGLVAVGDEIERQLVLGDKAEEAFRQSLLASQGGLGVFFSSSLVSTIMALGLIALFWPLIQSGWTRLRSGKLRPAE